MHTASVALTDVGRQRDHNEDACLADDAHGLYIVADGMGGAASGEVASRLAVERVSAFFRPRVSDLRDSDLSSPDVRQRLARLMDAAIQDACQHVYRAAVEDKRRIGMGTTLTAMLLLKNVAVVGHVGDSRLYLKRNDTIYHLTSDHSFVNEMVQRGTLSEEAALKHPMANLLTRAVGPQANVQADVNVLDVYDGDTFIGCTDGVTKAVAEDALLRTLTMTPELSSVARQVVNAANDAGGDDNATIVIVRATAEDPRQSGEHQAHVEDKSRVLSNLPLFSGLSLAHLQAVMNLAGELALQPGDVVVEAGRLSTRFFVVVRGRIMLSLFGAEVLEIPAGNMFGDVECFDGKPAMLEATAMTPAVVLTFEKAHLEDLCRRDPALGVQLLWRFTTALSNRVDEVLRRGTLTEES